MATDASSSASSLSRLTHDIVQDTYKTLHALLDSLSENNHNEDEPQLKRQKLLDFFLAMRHRFARLLVIVRWFMSYSAFHGSAQNAKDLAISNSQFFLFDADTLFWKLNDLKMLQSLPCALPEATEILTTFTFSRLPNIIPLSIGIDLKSTKQLQPPLIHTDKDSKCKDEKSEKQLIMAKDEAIEVDIDRNQNDNNDGDGDDITLEALHRLKLYTKRIVSDCLPKGIHILNQHQLNANEEDDTNRKVEIQTMKNISVKVGIEHVWSADVILDSLKEDSETNLRLIQIDIFVDTNPDAPTQMYNNRKRKRERKVPFDQSQLIPLRQMIDDRIKWKASSSIIYTHDFKKRIQMSLLTLCVTMSLECCANIAMSHIREQVGAMMILKHWRDNEISIVGRWNDTNHQNVGNDSSNSNKYHMLQAKPKHLGKEPVKIEYWKKSYVKSTLILSNYNSDSIFNAIKSEDIDVPQSNLISDAQTPTLSNYRSAATSSDSSEAIRKIIRIHHEPELPSRTSAIRPISSSVSGDPYELYHHPSFGGNKRGEQWKQRQQQINNNNNNIELHVSSINVQEILLRCARLRATHEFDKVVKFLSELSTKYNVTTHQINYGFSCSVLSFSFCGDEVGLVLGMSLLSGGVFVRARGNVETAIHRLDEIGKDLRNLLWDGESFFRNDQHFINTVVNIVLLAASIAWKEAMVRSVYAAGDIAMTTWPAGKTFLERPFSYSNHSVLTNTRTNPSNAPKHGIMPDGTVDHRHGGANAKDRRGGMSEARRASDKLWICPPFLSVEKKRPRTFMVLDSVSKDYVSDNGTNFMYHNGNKNASNRSMDGVTTANKRARVSQDNLTSPPPPNATRANNRDNQSHSSGTSLSNASHNKVNSLGLTIRKVGDFNFVQGQVKLHEEEEEEEEEEGKGVVHSLQCTGGMIDRQMSAYGMAQWAELRHEVRMRMMRETLLGMLLDQGVISSWKGREDDDENEDLYDRLSDDEMDEEEDSRFVNDNNKDVANGTPMSDVSPSALVANGRKVKSRRGIVKSNKVNEARVELRGQPLEVQVAVVRILHNEGWVLEVRLKKDTFMSSGLFGSESCYTSDIQGRELVDSVSGIDDHRALQDINGQGENVVQNTVSSRKLTRKKGRRMRILQFRYGGINGNCVRSCVREVMRARAAATLGMGLMPPSSNSFNTYINQTNKTNHINNHNNNTNNNNNNNNNTTTINNINKYINSYTKYRIVEWTHRYVLVECPIPGSSSNNSGIFLHVGLGATTIGVEIWPNKGDLIEMLKVKVIPLVEEVLSESRKQMGHCLQAILNVTLPMALSIERAIVSAVSPLAHKRSQHVRVKFSTVLFSRITFSSGHNNSTASKENNSVDNGSGNANKNAKRKSVTEVFGLDVDGHRLNGFVILTDVGRQRRYRLEQQQQLLLQQQQQQQQGTRTQPSANLNGHMDINVIPRWKAIIDKLAEKKLATALNHGVSFELKIDLLYKVVNAILRTVIPTPSSSSSTQVQTAASTPA